jgi:hypothetical protein
MDIIAACGLLFCRLLVGTGLQALAPSVCFGGDTTAVGLDAIVVLLLAIIAGCALGARMAGSSSVALVVGSLSVLAAGSAAIVHFIDY